MKLYELEHEIDFRECRLFYQDPPDDLDGEELKAWVQEGLNELDELKVEREKKLSQTGKYIKNETARANMYDKEAKRCANEARISKKRVERMLNYLSWALKPGEKFQAGPIECAWTTSTRVELEDDWQIPECYQRLSVEPDKKKIKQDLKEGAKVEGAKLVTRKTVRIK